MNYSKRNHGHNILRYLGCTLLASATLVYGGEDPLFSTLAPNVTPIPARSFDYNLGPTGARGWFHGINSHTRDSREIFVKSIEPQSPADGVLLPGDMIVGVFGERFDVDARRTFGEAIVKVEAADGKLPLLIVRDGKKHAATIAIEPMGAYAPTAPYDCPKTARILERMTAWLAQDMPPDGFHYLGGAFSRLGLLASGKVKYMDHVRRNAMTQGKIRYPIDALNRHFPWVGSYENLFLTEYYLATGDRSVLPAIEAYVRTLEKGVGRPGTWGHRLATDGVMPGYGAMNNAGLTAFMSIILAYECGVEVDMEIVRLCAEFFATPAGLGGSPYGDNPPWLLSIHNGKNATTAINYHLLGNTRIRDWFAKGIAASNPEQLEQGHTGNYWAQMWAPLGGALAGPEAFAGYMHRTAWYRDMTRRWDGSFIHQPLPHRREGNLAGGTIARGPAWVTGGFTLGYALPAKYLRMTGAPQSVFGIHCPEVLELARTRYFERDYEAAIAEATKFTGSEDPRTRSMAEQLIKAANDQMASIELTLAAIDAALEKGDVYLAQCQLEGLGLIMPETDERLVSRLAVLDTPEMQLLVDIGRRYHGLITPHMRTAQGLGSVYVKLIPLAYRHSLERIAENEDAGVYKELARQYLAEYPVSNQMLRFDLTPLLEDPTIASGRGLTISPTVSTDTTVRWLVVTDGETPEGWMEPAFDDAAWTETEMPISGSKEGRHLVRSTFTLQSLDGIEELQLSRSHSGDAEFFLNGEQILERSGGGSMFLKPSTVGLLREGQNVLAVQVYGAQRPRDQRDTRYGLHYVTPDALAQSPSIVPPPRPPAPDVYVSDLEPVSETLGWGWDPRVRYDRALTGDPITLQGYRYEKGIGTHAPSDIVFTLKPEYRRFVSTVGHDQMGGVRPRGDGEADAQYMILVDGKELARSPMLGLGEVWHFDVALPEDGKEILLHVYEGPYRHYDNVVWANAGFMLADQ